MDEVRVWSEQVIIPTYKTGEMEKNPMFFEKRVYQGSSGKVYPYPVIDKIEDEKEDMPYTIVFLENKYIQVQVMPELGGRIYRALDKTNQYDFVYYNRVIKPALVGLTGPWISGGIEFNWPQHHRPNTFGPVEYHIDDSKKDKKTVWLSETDRMYGTKVTTGISICEDSAVIEISSELYNPTGEPQTFLWWANPAVAVHDETQSIFPPDVHAVMDHGKRDVSRFPIATGTYYKMDYSSGVDISRYKNIPVPTSYMAYYSKYDFVGGYDYKKNAGVLHVADHHISPGKKQWTWGNGDFGKAWDRNLTDEDGPYIELMTGVFTDNQPDFTWLSPYSEKHFTQYFLPYKEVGEVSCANKDIVMGFKVENEKAYIKLYASRPLLSARVILKGKDKIYLDTKCHISPSNIYSSVVDIPTVAAHLLTLLVMGDGVDTLEYTPDEAAIEKMPEPAKAIGAPESMDNTESLLLAGMHLEQYRHATYEPDGYYLEGLKREPGNIRINNAYGNLLLRRGSFEEARQCFERAKTTALRHSPNPYDGEVFYNLGKALEYLNREDEAFDAYYKACWSDGWKTQSYLKLAQIAGRKKKYKEAIQYAQEALFTGARNVKARAVFCIFQRLLGDVTKAIQYAEETLTFDPMDFTALRELSLLQNQKMENASEKWIRVLRGDAHNYINLAQTYAEIGLYQEALKILDTYLIEKKDKKIYAMVYYFRASYLQALFERSKSSMIEEKSNSQIDSLDPSDVHAAWIQAARADDEYCFPNTLAEYLVLQEACRQNPEDARAYYYLGCFLYDKRRHRDAKIMWGRSVELNSDFPAVHRNLALYYANKEHDWKEAERLMTRAFYLNTTDARIFYEMCELYKKIGKSLEFQRDFMERHESLLQKRDDLMVAYAEVLNGLHEHEMALAIVTSRNFHPWEGGEGKVPAQHVEARIALAKQLLLQNKAQAALVHLEKATIYETNFGEGKLTGAQENNIYYYMGISYRAMGDESKAAECFETAAEGLSEPAGAMYYNDQPPHMIYYQGKALIALGRMNEAKSRFHKLVNYGEDHIFERQIMDYFAVSMPDFAVFETDLDERNRTHCYYMMGLGYMGLGEKEKAQKAFENALKVTPCHAGVRSHLEELETGD